MITFSKRAKQNCDLQAFADTGSARAVNRRYIAMYVARKDRTNASALFVSLSAVGMALGPLLALPLAHVPQSKILGRFSLQVCIIFCPLLSAVATRSGCRVHQACLTYTSQYVIRQWLIRRLFAGSITIGPITCGGYVVSAAWILYLLWCISFQDPLKVLAANKAAEERQASIFEPLQCSPYVQLPIYR